MPDTQPSPMRELMGMKIWILWEWRSDKGQRRKKPFAANGGPTGTDEKYRRTWVNHAEAVAAMEQFPDRTAGLGFVIPEGYFFLDIDHKAKEDVLVQMMLRRFDSYAEYSVSGSGIHIYGKCDPSQIPACRDNSGKLRLDRQFFMKNPNNGMELYIGGVTNRFAAFTGDVINGVPLEDCTQALLTTLDKDMRRKPKVKYSAKRDGEDRELFDIICDLRKQKNGGKFTKLFDHGDISDYGSHSEADAALCAMIAFRTGPDPEAVENVFSCSALVRDKWTEREDYREATVAAGIEACHGVFHRSKMEHPYFIKFKENGMPYVHDALLAKWTREHLDYRLVRDSGKQGLRVFVYENGVYWLYAEDMLQGIIKGYIAGYDEELVTMRSVRSACDHITTDLEYVSQSDLDADEGIINFQNGLLRLSDMMLLPHSPEVLSTIQIPCEWTGSAGPTPVFDRYLDTLTNGDREVQKLLLEFIGVCLSNVKGWRMKKSLFLVGAGDTGKSQLKSLVERLLGKGNFIGIDLKEIEARFGTGAIYGTRLAGSSDMSFLSVDELKTFKKITGGDSLFAELKGQQAFEFTYGGLLWFCMNRLPKFGGDDGQWVYDRIMVVECSNVIPKDKQDKAMADKLYAEREGIVYQAVCALRTVIANGYRFSEPDCVRSAGERYRNSNSTVISFYQECMCSRQGGSDADGCTTGKVYAVYKAWCSDNNNGYAKTAREFRETLAEHLGRAYSDIITHTKRGNFYRDITLTTEAREQYRRAYGYDGTEFLV